MTEAPRRCLKCPAPVPQAGRGRPRDYCSTGCKRAAEFEVRRITRRLERLEDDRSELRLNLDGGGKAAEKYSGPYQTAAFSRQLAAVEREIAATEDRLRTLLSAQARRE